MRVRPARTDDLDRVLAIHMAAFPDDRTIEVRRRSLQANPLGPFEDLHVIEDEGELLGHAFLFRLPAFFGGKRVPMAGIASVGVAPEARGRGVATALFHGLEEAARARGDALALLYPFRQGFYAKLGYAPVTPIHRIVTSPAAIPAAWAGMARTAKMRTPRADDIDEMIACYERAAVRSTGLLDRPRALWERRLCDERRHFLLLPGEGRRIRGYVSFFHDQSEAHADITVRVMELVAEDDRSKRKLFGALGAQRDQARTIAWNAPADDPFVLALEDADRARSGTADVEHPVGTIASGPMVKILDHARAFAARGYPREGRSMLALIKEDGPVSYELFARTEGGSFLERSRTELANDTPMIYERDLASMAFGGVSPTALSRIGQLIAEPEAVAKLDHLLRMPAFEVMDAF